MTFESPPPRPKRPIGIVVIAVLEFLGALLCFVFAAILVIFLGVAGVFFAVPGLILLVAGYLLLIANPLGKYITYAGLILGLLDPFTLLLSFPLLWYLQRPHIKAYFGYLDKTYRAYRMYAPPPPPVTSAQLSATSPTIGQRICPSCGSPMSYLANVNRYWCPKEKKYYQD